MCITKKQYPPTQDAGDDESMSDSVVTKDHKHTTRHIVSSSKRRSRGKHALPRFTRTFVDHRYRDHAHDPRICSDATVHTVARGGVTMAFPEKLCQMLTAAPNDGYENIISWQPHGRCFLIHDKEVFVRTIMPKFFEQTKLTSFQRQLNLYGFVRLTAGCDRGGYYHELFLRGRPDLGRRMVRTRVKGNGMKAAASPLTEPDFYAMEFCLESTDPTRPEITSMNKDFNDETETDGMESGETTTEDEEDCCASIMEQPQLHGKYPDASCSSPSVKIVTPYSSPRHNCHKPNSSMDVAHQLEWPTCSATLGSTLWETVSTNSSSDFDFPPLYHDFKNKIAKTSETLSLASILSPPPVLIAALQHNFRDDYDDRDWVLPQHEEFSVLDEGEEAFFEGRKFRFLDRYQPVDQTLTSIVVLGAEKSTQQRPEDIFGSFTSV